MKIKVKPEDFIVKEQTDFKSSDNGKYYLYMLEKTGWNSIDALKLIARENNLSFNALSYCGKKDRYAKTYQYITSDRKLAKTHINENVTLTFISRTYDRAAPSLIIGNRFEIKIRDLTKEIILRIKERIDEVKKYGFPNYFGEQRFGSYDKNQGFFAEKFLKAHYNGALKCLLCSIHTEDKKEEKERKRIFLERWGDFSSLKEYAKTGVEKKIFQLLSEKPKAFLNAIHLYPEEEISMAFSAYQSYLWNNMIKKLLLTKNVTDRIQIKEWIYPAYLRLSEDEFKFFKDMIIPVPGIKPHFERELAEKIYDEVLREEGLYQARFSQRKYRKVIMKSFPRAAIVIPEDLEILSESEDDLYQKKYALSLSFKLPRGSFATILLKSLMISS